MGNTPDPPLEKAQAIGTTGTMSAKESAMCSRSQRPREVTLMIWPRMGLAKRLSLQAGIGSRRNHDRIPRKKGTVSPSSTATGKSFMRSLVSEGCYGRVVAIHNAVEHN